MSGKKEVKQTAQIRAALMAGKNVVVDNCNVTVEERARIIQIGREFNVRLICVEFHSILEECLERNAKRPGKACVPPVAIYIKAAKYVASSISEGFDKVILVRGVENETPAQEILR